MVNHEWGRLDAKSSHELARLGAQAAILLNGISALTEFVFLNSLTHEGKVAAYSLAFIPIFLGIYVVGATLAALALLALSKSLSKHSIAWILNDDDSSKRGRIWWQCGLIVVVVALACFVASSGYLVFQMGYLFTL